jgi:hypothetical protein
MGRNPQPPIRNTCRGKPNPMCQACGSMQQSKEKSSGTHGKCAAERACQHWQNAPAQERLFENGTQQKC